ncbi:hypothetical protein DAPPUDRAFT_318603 [Daphnia pulex]|uniref:Uncharacterized protein n=1 Tax=Daphnia pulex TaxID=6669 RepID=E9GJB0_DAPPU|nr:hypothetical protein DAPPUDRAFT_318603 [Daphnia pulex]|eukprot:EFX80518.1 hypothetical protein DAPPUDRAFT_318603 [Daphnia pulex]
MSTTFSNVNQQPSTNESYQALDFVDSQTTFKFQPYGFRVTPFIWLVSQVKLKLFAVAIQSRTFCFANWVLQLLVDVQAIPKIAYGVAVKCAEAVSCLSPDPHAVKSLKLMFEAHIKWNTNVWVFHYCYNTYHATSDALLNHHPHEKGNLSHLRSNVVAVIPLLQFFIMNISVCFLEKST